MVAIVHLTSVHPRHDTRIVLKMCRSLAAAGHQVTLLVADGKGDEKKDDIHIIDVGKSSGRLRRMLGATRRVLSRALALNADVYHLHDPELLPVGLILKWYGKRVIFDAHEDVPQQILSKFYLPLISRYIISGIMARFEYFSCRRFDCVITATPVIRKKFIEKDIEAVDINNFPMLGELETGICWHKKRRDVCYVGSIVATRGIREIVAAMALCQSGARLNLCGDFAEKSMRVEVGETSGWVAVNELGFLTRARVKEILGSSVAGLVTLHRTPAYVDSLPVKMFEYMSAGLPVIASNFPLWREIIEGNECGICVDPLNPKAIAEAIDWLIENPDRAEEMGENGRRAVRERYNWDIEKGKLLALYDKLIFASDRQNLL